VAVYPVNESEIVEGIGKRLEIDLDTVFTLTNVDGMFTFVSLHFYSTATIFVVFIMI
jgi:hypothetical protein